MSNLFHVSAAPHSRSPVTTRNIMRDVMIALIPAGLFGIYNFGLRALLVILASITACLITEYFYCRLMKIPVSTDDYSAAVTGMLLAFNLPANIPIWIAILGSVFAILIVKMLFGGLGQNFMNPALAARAFLLISFPERMTDFAFKGVSTHSILDYFQYGAIGVNIQDAADAVSGATPLELLKSGSYADISLTKMFIGNIGGTIGETSAIAILIGAVYLLVRKVISLRIPLSYILTFVIFILLFGPEHMDMTYIAGQILGGGLLLGAFFMATDYVTSPATRNGQIVFGILLGIFTGIFRILGKAPEGVSYAIIFCNCLVPLIEKATVPKSFGKERVSSGK